MESFNILNNFFYKKNTQHLTPKITNVMETKSKSYQAKIKARVNKFLTSFDVQNFNINKRSILLELFSHMLLDLPRSTLENSANC